MDDERGPCRHIAAVAQRGKRLFVDEHGRRARRLDLRQVLGIGEESELFRTRLVERRQTTDASRRIAFDATAETGSQLLERE